MSSDKNLKKILSHLVSFDFAKLFNNNKTKTKIKKSTKLGIELVATKPIKKNERVAWYKFKLYNSTHNPKFRKSMYQMTVYNKNGNESKSLLGDLYPGSLEMPGRDNLTYYAFFSNEPSGNVEENCYIDIETSLNFKDRNSIKDGDTMKYSLKAMRNIKVGEPIVWCYGESYQRPYAANCD
tara:strand:+ start:1753 stop:2295 length:543 start_codon:yes stop_codon:yes gene_type:complete